MKSHTILAGVAVLSVLSTSVAYAADESDPPLPRFRPWQQVWQCNDIRVTIAARDPFSVTLRTDGADFVWTKIIWSSNAPPRAAPPANGRMTTSTCSPMALLSVASSRRTPRP